MTPRLQPGAAAESSPQLISPAFANRGHRAHSITLSGRADPARDAMEGLRGLGRAERRLTRGPAPPVASGDHLLPGQNPRARPRPTPTLPPRRDEAPRN